MLDYAYGVKFALYGVSRARGIFALVVGVALLERISGGHGDTSSDAAIISAFG